MLRSLKHIFKLWRIARVLSRHDAFVPPELLEDAPVSLRLARQIARLGLSRQPADDTEPGGQSAGKRLADALQSLGPSYIKFGQTLATRADLVGDDVASALSELQDRLPAFPGATARQMVEDELLAPVDSLFQSFDDQPVAAASIAQVHFAETSEGEPVAVKVLRPGVDAAFARDIAPLSWLAARLERYQPEFRRLRLTEVVRTFAQTVEIEMDLRLEAAAASELRENMGPEGFIVPKVDWQRTGRRVLTTERVDGIPIADRAALEAAGHDLPDLAAKLLSSFLTQAMGDGFFHADLHQGNLFVTPEGRLAAVDFGIMGRLDKHTQRYLAEILLGFIQRDYDTVARVHFDAGYVPTGKSDGLFAQAMRSVGEPILGRPAREISLAKMLTQLFQVTKAFDMQTQPQLLLLQKTMVVAEGVAQHLDPDVNTWEIAEPVVTDLMRDNFSPLNRVREAVEEGLEALRRFPELVERAERAAEVIADGAVKLDAGTVNGLAEAQARRQRPRTLTLWILGVFAFALAIWAL